MSRAAHPEIAPAALAAVYAHARRDYPKECCGLIFGPRAGEVADEARPCANIQDRLHAEDSGQHPRDGRTAYAFEPKDQFLLGKSLRSERPAKVIYHSHVDAGAYFSATDVQVALMGGDEPAFPGVEYLVVDVRVYEIRESRQFAWDDRQRLYVEVRRYGPPP